MITDAELGELRDRCTWGTPDDFGPEDVAKLLDEIDRLRIELADLREPEWEGPAPTVEQRIGWIGAAMNLTKRRPSSGA